MATVRAHVNASPSEVYRILANGWTYTQWVVGASHMRAVEADWPAVNSKIYHAIGLWPLTIRDYTQIEKQIPDRQLLLAAQGRPFGHAKIDLRLEPREDGTEVVMREELVGKSKWLMRIAAFDALVARRNAESLARLAALSERRTEP